LLQEWVRTHAGTGDLLLDLYGGNGNLSLPLLEDFARIVCIDTGAPEVEGPAPHFSFVRKSIQAWSVTDDSPRPTGPVVALLDPPREGIGELFPKLEARLSALGVTRVILVGCDVDAFARDSSKFLGARYRLARLGALDLFPQTPHLESLALFLK
jgi:23S rRNA (uracil1939-C5)-methyltransferase